MRLACTPKFQVRIPIRVPIRQGRIFTFNGRLITLQDKFDLSSTVSLPLTVYAFLSSSHTHRYTQVLSYR